MKNIVSVVACFVLLFACAEPPKRIEQQPRRTVVFYPPPPAQPRIQFLVSITNEDDMGVDTTSGLEKWLLGDKTSERELGKPYDIGSSKGKIYVLDRRFNKLLFIDLVNKKFDFLRDQRLGALSNPSGIWISKEDIKYIADMKRKQVVAFDQDNEFLRAYGDKDLFDKPVDVAVYDNLLYVCDMDKHMVMVLDKDSGELVATIGEMGAEEGTFYRPSHVTVDDRGNIFVNDAFNFRVQEFDQEGHFVRSFGELGDTMGSFARPKGIAIDRANHLYVVDAAFENIQIFDEQTGDLLLFIGGPGSGPGNMYLPAGVHIDYDNVEYFADYVDKDFRVDYLIYVGNFFGTKKLNIYGFGEWIGSSLNAAREANVVESEP
jgi:DNA-binding beta-propeller fold protein YncE